MYSDNVSANFNITYDDDTFHSLLGKMAHKLDCVTFFFSAKEDFKQRLNELLAQSSRASQTSILFIAPVLRSENQLFIGLIYTQYMFIMDLSGAVEGSFFDEMRQSFKFNIARSNIIMEKRPYDSSELPFSRVIVLELVRHLLSDLKPGNYQSIIGSLRETADSKSSSLRSSLEVIGKSYIIPRVSSLFPKSVLAVMAAKDQTSYETAMSVIYNAHAKVFTQFTPLPLENGKKHVSFAENAKTEEGPGAYAATLASERNAIKSSQEVQSGASFWQQGKNQNLHARIATRGIALYTDAHITMLIGLRLREANINYVKDEVNQRECSYLLTGTYPDEEDNISYYVLVTSAIDTLQQTKPLDFYINKESQQKPDRRDDRRDIFDEVLLIINQAKHLPVITEQNSEIAIKILFPYNITQSHWLTGEITIIKKELDFAITMKVHDPYGGGQMNLRNRQVLRGVIRNKIDTICAGAKFTWSFPESKYMARQASGDTVLCGGIVEEDIFLRVRGKSLNRQVYPIGAPALQQYHRDLVNRLPANTQDATHKDFLATHGEEVNGFSEVKVVGYQ